MSNRQYWIGVVARDHVQQAVRAGVAQLRHGRKEPLLKMGAGDGFIFYSPRESFPGGEPAQLFTGIGKVKTGQVYAGPDSPGPMPYRIDIQFFEANEIPIRPLIERLSFIEDKTHWGYPFRFGYLSIPEMDFKIIAEAMGRNFEKDFGE
jgi:hypothetical protein